MNTAEDMSLEEDIKQEKGFRNEHQKALVNILYTDGWLRGSLRELLHPHDLTNQQYNVLRILRGSHPLPLSTSAIRERMLDKMSDASRIVDRLCKKGLTERNTCSLDKRLVDVLITDKGLELLALIDGKEQGFERILANLSEEEAKALNTLLDKARG